MAQSIFMFSFMHANDFLYKNSKFHLFIIFLKKFKKHILNYSVNFVKSFGNPCDWT